MPTQHNILLTIAIPTYNRAEYLQICLDSLMPQATAFASELEIVVFDNNSNDETERVARLFIGKGHRIAYHRNRENIGSDRNIAQCFNRASGKYVLIFGDDDVLVKGALRKLFAALRQGEYGGVFLRPFGYDIDFISERPHYFGRKTTIYRDKNAFIRKVALRSTFISSIVINKSLIRNVDAEIYAGTNLVQSYLFFEAALTSEENFCFEEYLIAVKRDNSGGYRFTDVFAHNFIALMDKFSHLGLSRSTIDAVNRKSLWLYFPNNIVRLRASASSNAEIKKTYDELHAVYHAEPLFWICIAPSLKLPRLLGLLWSYGMVFIGRLVNGEFGRLWAFMLNRASKQTPESNN